MPVTTLTKRLVATAQPKDRPYELRDAQVRGLLLRVQPSGHKAWIVTWAHGKRRTLGSAGHLSLDQARDISRKVIAEFIQTGLPAIAKPKLPEITLQAFIDDHYGPWARGELKGAEDYIARLKRVFAKGRRPPALPGVDPASCPRFFGESELAQAYYRASRTTEATEVTTVHALQGSGEVVGFAILRLKREVDEHSTRIFTAIDHVYVMRKARSRGVGILLVRELLELVEADLRRSAPTATHPKTYLYSPSQVDREADSPLARKMHRKFEDGLRSLAKRQSGIGFKGR